MRFVLLSALVLLAATPAAAETLHERLMVLDTHLDTPINLVKPGWTILDRHGPDNPREQVDLPRMKEGGLDGGFWVIFTPQGPMTPEGYAAARDTALLRAVAIREMALASPGDFVLAEASGDAARIVGEGKRVVYQAIENSYPLGDDLSLLETFYKLGARMVSPAHLRNNQFADSATDPAGPTWNGLSPLGERWVAEANRLGMVIDASHASDAVFDQLLTRSKTPIILSHSGCRDVFDHPRNISDARLKALAAAGGVIQINSMYVAPTPARPGPNGEPPAGPQPPPPAFDDFMRHLLHALELIGPDHVGIGADWDGGGGVAGMADVAALPKITERLQAAGYSEADIAKIWGGNVIRLLKAAEAERDRQAPGA